LFNVDITSTAVQKHIKLFLVKNQKGPVPERPIPERPTFVYQKGPFIDIFPERTTHRNFHME